MDDRITVASLKEKGWTLDEALDHFIGEVHRPIRAAGKTPVVWQEMVSSRYGSVMTLIIRLWLTVQCLH